VVQLLSFLLCVFASLREISFFTALRHARRP
jgi:hypothetical protein